MIAGMRGAIAAMLYMWMRFGKPDPSMMGNSMLAGLVAITAPCAFVNAGRPSSSAAIAGVLVVWACSSSTSSRSTTRSARSASTASTAPGACSAVGLFSDGTYGDGWNGVPGTRARPVLRRCEPARGPGHRHRHLHRCGCSPLFYAFFKVVERLVGNRVSAEVEIEGLDMPEMGAMGYPDFVMTPGPEGHGLPRSGAGGSGAPVLQPVRSNH